MQQQPKTLNEFFLTFKDAADAAFENMKAMLWPFNFKKWIILAIITLCASWATFQPSFQMPSANNNSSGQAGKTISSLPSFNLSEIIPSIFIIVIAVIFILIIAVILMHIGSRFKFVLFKNILNQDAKISEYWADAAPRGKKLFFWVIVMSMIFIPVILLTFSVMLMPALLPRLGEDIKTFLLLFSSCIGALFLMLLSAILTVYNALIYTFTLPAMMKMDEKISVWEASRIIINRFIKMGLTGVLLTVAGLIIFYIALSVVSLILIILSAIPFILLMIITFPLIMMANNPVVYLIGGTIMFIASILFFLLLVMIMLPVSIFKESFNFALTSLLFPEYDTFFTRNLIQPHQPGIEGSPGSKIYYDYSENDNTVASAQTSGISLEKKDDNPYEHTDSNPYNNT